MENSKIGTVKIPRIFNCCESAKITWYCSKGVYYPKNDPCILRRQIKIVTIAPREVCPEKEHSNNYQRDSQRGITPGIPC